MLNQIFAKVRYYRLPILMLFIGAIIFFWFWWEVSQYLPFPAHSHWLLQFFSVSLVLAIGFASFLVFNWQKGVKATELCVQEINMRQEMERKLDDVARHDTITGLPSRYYFYEVVTNRIASQVPFALLIVSTPSYNFVNNMLGIEFGDKLLVQLGRLFKKVLRDSDFIARLDAGNFAIILNNMKDPHEVFLQTEKFVNLLSGPMLVDIYQTDIFINAGIVLSSQGSNATQLMQYAYLAASEAIKKGPNAIEIFTETLRANIEYKRGLEQALRTAIHNQEFYLVYQPIFNLKTNKIIGAEALLRWEHPKFGVIDPQDFINVAENYGLMLDIGKWVFEKASDQLLTWQKNWRGSNFYISINCSTLQMQQTSFIEFVQKKLSESQLRSEDIVLEITETALIPSMKECADILKQFNQLHIKIAIDDFGTGYASINYLCSLPIAILKVDKSLISHIEQDAKQVSVIKAIIELSRAFNIKVLAEGVERETQMKILQDIGCDFVQGFYLAKPMSVSEMESFAQAFLV
ncbi:MAG: response regulator receiver modulated diguanylate cyclase/phosphodiesterase [Gammaproteobacteria bacterium]|nr:response regulator receiver modulated diguanylate cyclase/phosphodiesterase [Gammaproteobacteria bacterium]